MHKRCLPLEGIRVLDFSRHLPGPLTTAFLAELGAEVTKIEDPKRGDPTRWFGGKTDQPGTFYRSLNHRKKIINLDLSSSEGQKKARNLVAQSRIVVESFRPGIMAKWGLGFSDISRKGLIYCSINGFGSGSKKDHSGHDINFLALSGLLWLNRTKEGVPIIPGFQAADVCASLLAVINILAGLLLDPEGERDPIHLEITATGSAPLLALLYYSFLKDGLVNDDEPFILTGPLSNYNVYQTKDGRWISLGALEDKFRHRLAEVLKIDPSFVEDVNKLKDIFLSEDLDYWMSLSERFDLLIEPVLKPLEAIEKLRKIGISLFKGDLFKIPVSESLKKS